MTKKLIKYSLPILLISKINFVFANDNTLVVGSTFDYPPITYIENNTFKGQDINLIKKFATDNKQTIKFVKTTWQTLNTDLVAHKFDIAIGGISENSNRKKLFLLSNPVGKTQKVPLIRCSDINKFYSINVINNPNIIVVENKGGTNEIFAKQVVPKAKILVVNNNILPFEYLINKQADVMFTDDVEADYKHTTLPSLCKATLKMDLPFTNKVFMFNKDATGQILQKKFNLWLEKYN